MHLQDNSDTIYATHLASIVMENLINAGHEARYEMIERLREMYKPLTYETSGGFIFVFKEEEADIKPSTFVSRRKTVDVQIKIMRKRAKAILFTKEMVQIPMAAQPQTLVERHKEMLERDMLTTADIIEVPGLEGRRIIAVEQDNFIEATIYRIDRNVWPHEIPLTMRRRKPRKIS